MLHHVVNIGIGITPWMLIAFSVLLVILAGGTALYEYYKAKYTKLATDEPQSYRKATKIAILIASKNGEKTIARTVGMAKRNRRNVFVVSDGSTDATVQEARKAGAHVLALRKNIGKPSALYRAYKHFGLGRRYDAIAILDDDVVIERDFIRQAQHHMTANVAISVGKNLTEWPDAERWNIWLAARAYSYWCYQITLRRLQSAYNVMNCISGSNSLYRTAVLDKVLSGQTPYIVDDTFWTLETHRLHLGNIVYAPKARAWIQDPTTFHDWYKQNLRWMWGTFQGIIGHHIGTEFNKFHMTYVLLITEWVLYILSGPFALWLIWRAGIARLPLELVILSAGYALWVGAAAIALKRPRLMLFVPAVVVIDFIFRGLMVHALVKAFRQKTVKSCVWNSPTRFDTRAAIARS